MTILSSELYRTQLKSILSTLAPVEIKSFKLYLDTIILNMPSKAGKYKPSLYFEDERVKDIDHQGYTIPFYHDEEKDAYVILGIIKKNQNAEKPIRI